MSFTNAIRRSISQSIASLENLKALRLFATDFDQDDMKPLARLKSLKHFELEDYGGSGWRRRELVQFILRNSMSTLQSLSVKTSGYGFRFLENWDKNLKASVGKNTPGTSDNRHVFTALRSFGLSGMEIDDSIIQELKAIDFTRLCELTLENLTDASCLFYPHLTSLATSYQGTADTPISLRTLRIDMSDHDGMYSTQQKNALFESQCRFIASTDVLTTLEIHDYGHYPSSSFTNPGLPELLLGAILKHKGLKVLRILYRGRLNGFEIPYLGAKTVERLVDGLPQLREFGFAPVEEQMLQIGRALLRGSHLESVNCAPHASWGTMNALGNPGLDIMSCILEAFLANPKISLTLASTNKPFKWEDHYTLNRVSASYRTWDIASEFQKGGRGAIKAERFTVNNGHVTREVWYRSVKETVQIHVGYDNAFEWANKVDREMQ